MSGYYIIKKDGSISEWFNTKEAAEEYLRRQQNKEELRIEPRGIVSFIPNNNPGRLH